MGESDILKSVITESIKLHFRNFYEILEMQKNLNVFIIVLYHYTPQASNKVTVFSVHSMFQGTAEVDILRGCSQASFIKI